MGGEKEEVAHLQASGSPATAGSLPSHNKHCLRMTIDQSFQGKLSCTIFPAGPPFVGVQSKYATVLTFPPLIHSAGDWRDRVDALFATWKWPERRWPDPPKDQMSRYLNKTCVRQGFECHL